MIIHFNSFDIAKRKVQIHNCKILRQEICTQGPLMHSWSFTFSDSMGYNWRRPWQVSFGNWYFVSRGKVKDLNIIFFFWSQIPVIPESSTGFGTFYSSTALKVLYMKLRVYRNLQVCCKYFWCLLFHWS